MPPRYGVVQSLQVVKPLLWVGSPQPVHSAPPAPPVRCTVVGIVRDITVIRFGVVVTTGLCVVVITKVGILRAHPDFEPVLRIVGTLPGFPVFQIVPISPVKTPIPALRFEPLPFLL